jgi:hypothetical protein
MIKKILIIPFIGALTMAGLFSNLFAQEKPFKKDALNKIYELLFCDDIKLYKTSNEYKNEYPWNLLFDGNTKELQKLINDKNVESRVKILAYNKIRLSGQKNIKKELLGVIVEVPQEKGLDVVACYKDGTARYLNQGENIIIWEEKDNKIENTIKQIFLKANNIYKAIGPWDKKRLPFPKENITRITLLASDGFYFGQGPTSVFFKDQLASPTLSDVTKLLLLLIEKTKNK